ncbi:MAG TPA: trehalose-phosphatase [Mycobacteriales bacterium]|nr:trehalose-phosphatase [Mycobacteriales bacterium]
MLVVTDVLAPIRPVLSRAVVALDFDGTLAPIVARPQDARPASGAVELLVRLAPRVQQLAVVTGRPALTAVELGGLDRVPDLIVLGHYGMQRWQRGALHSPPPAPGVAAVRDALAAMLPPGGTLEDKVHSVVLHTRGCGDPEAELARVEPGVRALAAAHGLEVVGGRAVWELRPPGVDKGQALRALAADVPPAGVLVAGDDIGDLPLFAAAAGLGVPVVRIAVLGADVAPEVAAAADASVDGPSGLVALLGTL